MFDPGFHEKATIFNALVAALHNKSRATYSASLWALIRGLWANIFQASQFIAGFSDRVDVNLTEAFLEGAARNGFSEDELSDKELGALRALIFSNQVRVPALADYIIQNNRASGGLLRDLRPRMSLWSGRWAEAKSLGFVITGKDRKLEWIVTVGKKHCKSCLRLNGKVKRASFWTEKGILPRVAGAFYLECRGFRCGCRLVNTNLRLSRGPLPSLP